MAKSSSVKFTDNSDSAKNGLLEQQKLALRATAKFLKAKVKEAAPVKTGRLKKNIATWVRVSKKTQDVKLQIGVYNKAVAAKKGLEPAFYAHIVEFGSKRQAAHPFLKPTIQDNVSGIREEQAKYLPDIKNLNTMQETDEEIE